MEWMNDGIGEFVSRKSRKDGIQCLEDRGRSELANYLAENKPVFIKKPRIPKI